MAALTAAELQRRRQELEGAPDPFPALPGAEAPSTTRAPAKQQAQAPAAQVDADDSQAFPALAPSARTAPTKSSAPALGWGAGPRISAPVSRTVTDSFELDVVDLSTAGKDGNRATSLSEVLRLVNAKFKVKTEASSQPTGYTLFTLKADSQKDIEKAKKQLISLLSPQVTLTVNAPASTIAAIIGPKGAFLKQIRDETGARVDIPRRDTAAAAAVPNGKPATGDDDDDEPEETVPITITAAGVYAREAKRLIDEVISVRTSKTTQRVREVPAHILPFIAARKPDFESLASGGEVAITVNGNDVHVSGNRESVATVVEAIKAGIEDLKANLTSIKMPMPKRQHRLLTGKAAEEILNKSKCSVQVPKADSGIEEIALWARPADLPGALAAVQQAATSQHIHSFQIPGKHAQALQVFNYLSRTGFSKTVVAAHPGVSLHAPSQKETQKDPIFIDIIGEKATVESAAKKLSEMCTKLHGATREVEIDWLIHRAITGKYAKKLKAFQDAQHVAVFWPAEASESSKVLIVYDPNADPKERAAHLDEVVAELLKFAKDVADVKTEVISVDSKWHSAIVGKNGTTLNAIIGDDSTLAIKLGKDAGKLLGAEDQATADTIAVRGVASDVTRAIKDIHRIVESAKNDEIDNGYSVEFHILREYVGRIVGAQGAAVNKLRESLGIEVDFTDEDETGKEKEKENGLKKKKSSSSNAKARVTLKGRKENVEEAKRRIMAQVERMADETFEILKIPRQYHPSLIGRGAKYVVRLEEKYSVKITFPRESDENGEGKTREQLKADEVLVKGGKKGVADAKKELVDAVEFEKESNNSVKFTVPTRSVARILGKSGAQINEIKDNTGAQIDIDKAEDNNTVTNVTVRGTKAAIQEAKTVILRIAGEVDDEVTETIKIESRFHRTIIGARGQGLRDLIVKCGGPEDPRAQAGLAHFPRQGETSDEVSLRGPKAIVSKLKAELESIAAGLRDRVVLGVSIPAAQHRALIGRGGQTLNALQDKHSVQVQFPGSRSYSAVGEPSNASELTGVDAADLVKVSGGKNGCEAAIKEMLSHVKTVTPAHEKPAANGHAGTTVEDTIEVPVKYHHAISQGGTFFRGLRSYGVNVDHSVTPPKPTVPRPSANGEARIDDADGEATSKEVKWDVQPNYGGVDETVATWTLKARDQAGLDRAKKAVEEAIETAKQASHVGFLTVTDRSVFPRIVGSKGANVARLRGETGAEITVGRDDNIITLVGSESAIQAAKGAIIEIITNAGKPRPRA